MKIHFFVGSTNPVKINAIRVAALSKWPNVVVQGIEVKSGVGHQPMTDRETRKGAENRATKALKMGMDSIKKKPSHTVFLGVGLEGGVFETRGEMWSTVWCAVVDQQGNTFVTNGARLKVPALIAQKIRSGLEMGHAMQELTQIHNIKQERGMLGIITKNFVDRTEEYQAISKLTIGLWYGQDWADNLPHIK